MSEDDSGIRITKVLAMIAAPLAVAGIIGNISMFGIISERGPRIQANEAAAAEAEEVKERVTRIESDVGYIKQQQEQIRKDLGKNQEETEKKIKQSEQRIIREIRRDP